MLPGGANARAAEVSRQRTSATIWLMAETAIVVVVPEAEPAIDLARRRHTADGADGMPAHITLLYPFIDSNLLVSGRIAQLRDCLASFSPFDDELNRIARFQRLNEAILWLAPRASDPFIAMIEALRAEFPEHPPYGGDFQSIIPHLTVAISGDPDVLTSIEVELTDQLPIPIRVEAVTLFEHTELGWELRASIPL
jgi:2'-5' RNA ligase